VLDLENSHIKESEIEKINDFLEKNEETMDEEEEDGENAGPGEIEEEDIDDLEAEREKETDSTEEMPATDLMSFNEIVQTYNNFNFGQKIEFLDKWNWEGKNYLKDYIKNDYGIKDAILATIEDIAAKETTSEKTINKVISDLKESMGKLIRNITG
jgi:hypothetical protein